MEENQGPKVAYFKLPPELAQAIVNYLATKPYQEVFQVMPQIMNLEGVPEVTPEMASVPGLTQEEVDQDILASVAAGE